MLRSEVLNKMIKEAVEEIKEGDIFELLKQVEVFRINGIIANMHVGCNKNGEMDEDTENGKVLKLEWFAGSLVDMVEKDALYGINAWLNMSDRILK